MMGWKQLTASRSTGAALAVCEMVAIYGLSHRSWKCVGPGFSNGLTNFCHFPLYAILGALLAVALGIGLGEARSARSAWGGAAIAVIYGVFDEWHQGTVPGRDCSLFDVVTNAVSAGCGTAALRALLYQSLTRAVWWLLIGSGLALASSFILPESFPHVNLLLHRAFFG